MGQEIERKFLVSPDLDLSSLGKGERIVQGYLNSHSERTVRVRVQNRKAFLTIKGSAQKGSFSRLEFEFQIPLKEAQELIQLCEPFLIKKVRFSVHFRDHVFVVDQFEGRLQGLVIAEIELTHENEKFENPPWLGEEVTGQKKYYNSALSKKKKW